MVRAERFLPAAADAFETLGFHAVSLDEQALDFVCALFAEIDELTRTRQARKG